MKALVSILTVVASSALAAQQRTAPIIDMHLHALAADANGPPPMALCAPGLETPALDPRESWPQVFTTWAKNPRCPNPIWGPTSDDSVMTQTLEILKRRNIFGVASGPLLDRWRQPGGERIIPGLGFTFSDRPLPTPDQIRQSFTQRRYAVFAEIAIQYDGVSPSDERFEPYLAVAEQLDVPVGIHMGLGPPGAPYLGELSRAAA